MQRLKKVLPLNQIFSSGCSLLLLQNLPPPPPWQSQGAVWVPPRWRSTIPGLISCQSPKPTTSSAAVGSWIKRHQLQRWLLHSDSVIIWMWPKGSNRLYERSANVWGCEGVKTVSLKRGVVNTQLCVCRSTCVCVCVFGVTSFLIFVETVAGDKYAASRAIVTDLTLLWTKRKT